MTKQEIKDLVAAKIAGQGSQVDIGGALADILSGIVDAIPEGGGDNIVIYPDGETDDYKPEDIARAIEVMQNGGRASVAYGNSVAEIIEYDWDNLSITYSKNGTLTTTTGV